MRRLTLIWPLGCSSSAGKNFHRFTLEVQGEKGVTTAVCRFAAEPDRLQNINMLRLKIITTVKCIVETEAREEAESITNYSSQKRPEPRPRRSVSSNRAWDSLE